MRTEFIQAVTNIFEDDNNAVLLLGDIGVHGFEPLATKYPSRVINIGICEQATIGVCAGMAMEGLHPIFYTIAPFAVERCLEQIKIDIGYHNLPVSIVSIGGSYDYSALGCTHHCPADVSLMKTIPNMHIFTPAYKEDVISLLELFHGTTALYMRLSERPCTLDIPKGEIKENVVLAYGDILDRTILACRDLDVTVLYRWGVQQIMNIPCNVTKIAIIEPFYEGTMIDTIQPLYPDARILSIGIPHRFLHNYGTREEHDNNIGLDSEGLRIKLIKFFYGE